MQDRYIRMREVCLDPIIREDIGQKVGDDRVEAGPLSERIIIGRGGVRSSRNAADRNHTDSGNEGSF
jgi:hypothetical protein